MPIDTQATINAAWGESLTYTRGGGGGDTSVTGTRHLLGTTEGATSYGVYQIQRELFTLATDAVAFTPRLRDAITPTGLTARVVTSVSGSPFLKFWKLEAQYPSLIDDLDETAAVRRASNAPTNEGLRNPTYSTVATVACRLQPDTREREFDTIGRVSTRAKFTAVFGSAVTLNAGDIVEVSSVKYEVVRQSEVESLGLLTFASVERVS